MSNPDAPILKAVHTTAVIDNETDCDQAIEKKMSDCERVKMVGLHCEWYHRPGSDSGSKVRKDFIVTLCTYGGYCALFRMNKFHQIPDSLQNLLEGTVLIKIGVTTPLFSTHLLHDYGIGLNKFGDLYSYVLQNQMKTSPLTEKLRDVRLDRDESGFDHKKWTAQQLSEECIALAAEHAHQSLELEKLLQEEDPDYTLSDLNSLGF